ncbi:DUF6188 family protein [Williamsia soli]|uniref:DUF6188 family protein n=1 Tax=Williamsia soli TaxID=364929 RepID=UPI001A9F34E1|nr:DUF6188 family protein [Williamsia soli]
MQLWIQSHVVERLTFDDNLTLFFNGHHELVLWVPFSLTSPPVGGRGIDHDDIDPARVIPEQRPLFTMLGHHCDVAECDDHGALHLEFGDGSSIDLPTDPSRPSWELFAKRRGYATCERTDEVRIIEHHHAVS